MIIPFRQNWKISTLPFSISLYNRVNTGGSFDTPSGLVANQKNWAARGFQGLGGYGPMIQYPGAGMDGLGCKCGSGMGQVDLSMPVDFGTSANLPAPVQNILSATGTFGWMEWTVLGVFGYMLLSSFLTTKRAVGGVTGAVTKRRAKVRKRREAEAEESGAFFGLL